VIVGNNNKQNEQVKGYRMKNMKKFNLVIIAGALCLGSALQAQDAARTDTPPSTGTNAVSNQNKKMNKCSCLIGSKVQNAQGETLGKISDIVLDLNNGRVSYCVLDVAHKISSTPKHLAVPIGAFQCSPDESHLILNADKEKVAQAQGFESDNWPAANNPAWGAEPFWQEPRPTAPSSHELPRLPSSQ
jgi:sporulation protein YlmC with PRC-barrel domain